MIPSDSKSLFLLKHFCVCVKLSSAVFFRVGRRWYTEQHQTEYANDTINDLCVLIAKAKCGTCILLIDFQHSMSVAGNAISELSNSNQMCILVFSLFPDSAVVPLLRNSRNIAWFLVTINVNPSGFNRSFFYLTLHFLGKFVLNLFVA